MKISLLVCILKKSIKGWCKVKVMLTSVVMVHFFKQAIFFPEISNYLTLFLSFSPSVVLVSSVSACLWVSRVVSCPVASHFCFCTSIFHFSVSHLSSYTGLSSAPVIFLLVSWFSASPLPCLSVLLFFFSPPLQLATAVVISPTEFLITVFLRKVHHYCGFSHLFAPFSPQWKLPGEDRTISCFHLSRQVESPDIGLYLLHF